MRYCPTCGHELPIAASFCPTCGASVEETHLDADETTEASRLRSFLTPWILHIGVSIGAVVGGTLGFLTERGIPGLVTALGLVGGGAAGLYVGQTISMARSDDQD